MSKEKKLEKIEQFPIQEGQYVLNQIKEKILALNSVLLALNPNVRQRGTPAFIKTQAASIIKLYSKLQEHLLFLRKIAKHEYGGLFFEHAVVPVLNDMKAMQPKIQKAQLTGFEENPTDGEDNITRELFENIHSLYVSIFEEVGKLHGMSLYDVTLDNQPLAEKKETNFNLLGPKNSAQKGDGVFGKRSRRLVDEYREASGKVCTLEAGGTLLAGQYKNAQEEQNLLSRINPAVTGLFQSALKSTVGEKTLLLYSGSSTKDEVENLLNAAIHYVATVKKQGGSGDIALLPALCKTIVLAEAFVHFHLGGEMQHELYHELESISKYVQYQFLIQGFADFNTIRPCLEILEKTPLKSKEEDAPLVSSALTQQIKKIANHHAVLLGEQALDPKFQSDGALSKRSTKQVNRYKAAKLSGKGGVEYLGQLLSGQYQNATEIQHLLTRIKRGAGQTGLKTNGPHTAQEVENLLDAAMNYVTAVEIRGSKVDLALLPAICTAIVAANTFMGHHRPEQQHQSERLIEHLVTLYRFTCTHLSSNDVSVVNQCRKILGTQLEKRLNERSDLGEESLVAKTAPSSSSTSSSFFSASSSSASASSSTTNAGRPHLVLN